MVDSQSVAQIVSDVSVIIYNLTVRDSFDSSQNIVLRKLDNVAAFIEIHCKGIHLKSKPGEILKLSIQSEET